MHHQKVFLNRRRKALILAGSQRQAADKLKDSLKREALIEGEEA